MGAGCLPIISRGCVSRPSQLLPPGGQKLQRSFAGARGSRVRTPRRIGGNRRRRPLCLAATIALAVVAQPLVLFAAADIQQINLGPHAFYVPKAWMQGGAVTAYAKPSTQIQQPQESPIEATDLAVRPGEDWRPYNKSDLPGLIRIRYATRTGPPPLDPISRQWLDKAASMQPDADGFVRVATGFMAPGRQPQWEAFLYKGYLNKFGQPLIVKSNNIELSPGYRIPSTVVIGLDDSDLSLQYDFDNKKFDEAAWWNLYRRVLTFLEFLQRPQ